MTSHPTDPKRSLDELLGYDADPVMGNDAKERLRRRLAEARSGDAGSAEAELNVVLAFDSVNTPSGLAERVIDRVRAEQGAAPRDVLTPVAAKDDRGRRWRPRLLLPIAGAAAAALTLWMVRGGGEHPDETSMDPSNGGDAVAIVTEFEVSDDLLASLSVLENMDFVTDELDPFEADALFLFEPEDQVLLDLLVSETYEFDGMDVDGEAGGPR